MPEQFEDAQSSAADAITGVSVTKLPGPIDGHVSVQVPYRIEQLEVPAKGRAQFRREHRMPVLDRAAVII